MSRNILAITLAAFLLIAGCDGSRDTPKNVHTVEDFCNPWLDFFKTDLQFGDVKINISDDPKTPIEEVKSNGSCSFTSRDPWTGAASTKSASALITPVRDEDPSFDRSHFLTITGYTPLPGHTADIWVRDHRVALPTTMKSSLTLISRVGRMGGQLEIVNDAGSLMIADEQVGRAAELLIRLTRDMGT